MWPDAPDWPPHRISILTLAVFSRHTCRHTCHFQHNHYSCPVLLEQCRALKSQARQQSPCLVRTESAALFSSDTDFSPSPTCAKGLRLTVPRSVPAGSRLVRGFSLLWYLFCPCARAPTELHVMSSIQRTMRTCTRGASGAGVSVPAARGIPNSRAPSCHLERACRLRLAAGTRAAPQRSWHFFADVERERHRRLVWGRHVPEAIGARIGPPLGPSQPRGTALRHACPGLYRECMDGSDSRRGCEADE